MLLLISMIAHNSNTEVLENALDISKQVAKPDKPNCVCATAPQDGAVGPRNAPRGRGFVSLVLHAKSNF